MEVVPYILATAGHVDHGKSALVRALTGIDPDRLPEEKARGITIELGFAHLRLPSPGDVSPPAEYQVGIVDVPGHEDFVRNMVAGIGSIDAAMLVVAADDGWMPQTEEHLQILTYLGVTRGVVALTKIDLLAAPSNAATPFSGRPEGGASSPAAAEESAVAAVRDNLQNSPLADAPILPTSVVTGRGLAELKAALAAVLARTPPQPDLGKPRLPVDRAFVLKGVGTVVTGTLTGGSLRRGEAVVIQPSNRPAKVRTVQTHNHEVEVGRPGSRVALNLPDLAVDSGRATGTDAAVGRGDVVTLPSIGAASETVDLVLRRSGREWDAARDVPLKDGLRVRVHHGSGDSAARVYLLGRHTLAAGESTPAQLRFESPVFLFAGDRVVIRDSSARHTLAGGIVLDPDAGRQGFRGDDRRQFLDRRAAAPGDAAVFVATHVEREGAAERNGLLAPSRFSAEQITAAVNELARGGRVILAGAKVIDAARWQTLRAAAAGRIGADHQSHPEQLGMKLADLKQAVSAELPAAEVFDTLVADLCCDGFSRLGAVIRRSDHHPALPPKLQAAGAKLRKALAAKPFEPPGRKDLTADPLSVQAMKFLLDTGEAVAVGDDLVLSAEAVQRAGELVRQYLTARSQATASDLKQALGTTRRVMMPLLEFLDAHGLTQRLGDLRVLRVAGKG